VQPWHFSPISLLFLSLALLGGILAILAWARRPARGATWLALMLLATAWWLLCHGLEMATQVETTAILMTRLGYLGVLTIPATWLLFALDYTERLPRDLIRLIIALLVEPLLVLLALWTNDRHHAFYAFMGFSEHEGQPSYLLTYGPLFWLHTAYSYALLLAGSLLLILPLLRHSAFYRKKAPTIVVAVAVPWLLNLINISPWLPRPHPDLTPLGLLISGALLLIGLFRTPLVALAPLARERLIQITDEGLLVLDTEHRILDINPAACRLLGVDAEQVIGQRATRILEAWPQWLAWLESRPSAEQSLELQPGPEHWVEVRSTPILDAHNRPVGLLMRLHDITARKQAESALRRSEARYRLLVETSPEAIFLMDPQGRFRLANPQAASLFGLEDTTTLFGRSWLDFAAPEEHPRLQEALQAVLHEGETQRIEYVGLKSDGQPSFVEATLTALHPNHAEDPQSAPEIMALMRDISSTRVVQAELEFVAQEERRQRELAQALSQAALIVTASLEFEEVLERLLEEVQRVVPYDSGSVMLLRNGKVRVARMRGYERFGEQAVALAKSLLFDPQDTPNLAWMIEKKRPLIVSDVWNDPNWIHKEEMRHIRSWVGAPIITRDEVIGFFSLDKTEPGFYQPEHAELLALFARLAAIALENAQLFAEAQRRAVEAETLRQAAAAITSALDLEGVLDLIISSLRQVVPYDSCSVFLLEKGYLRLVRGAGFTNLQALIGQRFPAGNPLVEESFRTGEPIILEDAQADPRYSRWGEAEAIRGWIGLPLIAHGTPIGYLTLDSHTPGFYKPEHARLAQAFASQAAIALENARLFEQVRQAAITDPLTGLSNRRHFFELARREFARARRYGSTLSILLLDVDNLKVVNDTSGHLMGDRLLQLVGRKMLNQLRQPDLPARYGGDEFIALLPETNLERAMGAAERLRRALAAEVLPNGEEHFPVSVSIGVAELDASCRSLEMLIDYADRALYFAKQQGKGCVAAWKHGAPVLVAQSR